MCLNESLELVELFFYREFTRRRQLCMVKNELLSSQFSSITMA